MGTEGLFAYIFAACDLYEGISSSCADFPLIVVKVRAGLSCLIERLRLTLKLGAEDTNSMDEFVSGVGRKTLEHSYLHC